MNLEVQLGIDIDTLLTVAATVGDGSISGAYLKVFQNKDADPRSNNRATVHPFPVAIQIERFFDLPDGSAPRVELDVTAGDSAIGVNVSAFTTTKEGASVPVSVAGISGETLAISLPTPTPTT